MIKPTKALLNNVINIGWQASKRIMEIYQQTIEISNKDDGSPLTQADMASHHLIMDTLGALLPDSVIISEENADLDTMKWNNPQQFWLIDPLDGTKEFINRNGEFTINIALIDAGQPVLGMVCAPALNTLYAGMQGYGAFKMNKLGERASIAVISDAPNGLHVLGSRSHADQTAMEHFLKNKKIASFKACGSSLKFCQIAEGLAHLYPRFGRTMEWDTAAGHAVLMAAGGEVKCLDGKSLCYGKAGFENPHFIAKAGDFSNN